MSISEKMDKKTGIYTMAYHSAIRKDEILPFVTPGMNLDSIVLREKAKSHMISLICKI